MNSDESVLRNMGKLGTMLGPIWLFVKSLIADDKYISETSKLVLVTAYEQAIMDSAHAQ